MKNPTGIIFRRALYDSRKTILGWGIGMAIYALYIAVIYPYIEEFTEINEMLEIPIMQALLGGVADFTSPGGFIANYFFVFGPLILAVFSVLYGLGIVAAEEDQGTLDVLLGTPVTRSQVIVEKFAAGVVVLALILLLALAGFALGMLFTPSLRIAFGDMLLGVYINH